MVVIRVEYVNDQFCKVFLLHCLVVISSVELIQFEVCDRFCVPYTQRIDYVVSISNDRHIVGNSENGLIILLDKDVFSSLRILLETDVSSETNFLCVLFSAEFKRISLFQPVVRHFNLVTVFNFLLEHTVTIADAASICRVIQRCKGIKETCCKSSQTAVSESRVRLLVLDHVEVESHLVERLFYIFVNCHVDKVISKGTAHKKFH